jgi:peptidoglycan/LPS O-acetylase OafA/YrhL
MPGWLGAAAIFAGIISWLCFGSESGNANWEGVIWGIPAALIVAGTVLGLREPQAYTSRAARFAILLGDISFSLYLLHLFAMRPVTLLLNHTGFRGVPYASIYFVLFIPAAIGLAYLSYRFFELPINHHSRKSLRAW